MFGNKPCGHLGISREIAQTYEIESLLQML